MGRKLVRDLRWALSSTPLLLDSDPEAETAWLEMMQNSSARLDALDLDPSPLEAFMANDKLHPPCGRLQSYFGALIQFWLSANDTGEKCLTHSRLAVARRRLSLEIKLLASLRGGLCLHCEPSVMFAICEQPEDADWAGRLVGVDLDSNLLHKARTCSFKREIAHCPPVQRWVATHLGAEKIVSTIRIAGELYLPFAAGVRRWWCCGDMEQSAAWSTQLIAESDPASLWAIVDPRHMLAEAHVVDLPRDQRHFTRSVRTTIDSRCCLSSGVQGFGWQTAAGAASWLYIR